MAKRPVTKIRRFRRRYTRQPRSVSQEPVRVLQSSEKTANGAVSQVVNVYVGETNPRPDDSANGSVSEQPIDIAGAAQLRQPMKEAVPTPLQSDQKQENPDLRTKLSTIATQDLRRLVQSGFGLAPFSKQYSALDNTKQADQVLNAEVVAAAHNLIDFTSGYTRRDATANVAAVPPPLKLPERGLFHRTTGYEASEAAGNLVEPFITSYLLGHANRGLDFLGRQQAGLADRADRLFGVPPAGGPPAGGPAVPQPPAAAVLQRGRPAAVPPEPAGHFAELVRRAHAREARAEAARQATRLGVPQVAQLEPSAATQQAREIYQASLEAERPREQAAAAAAGGGSRAFHIPTKNLEALRQALGSDYGLDDQRLLGKAHDDGLFQPRANDPSSLRLAGGNKKQLLRAVSALQAELVRSDLAGEEPDWSRAAQAGAAPQKSFVIRAVPSDILSRPKRK